MTDYFLGYGATWVGLVAGVVSAWYLILSHRLSDYAPEHAWSAVWSNTAVLIVWATAQVAFGAVVVGTFGLAKPTLLGFFSGFTIGLLVGGGPSFVDVKVREFTAKRLKPNKVGRVQVLRLVRQRIHDLQRNDNFAWQNGEGEWRIPATSDEVESAQLFGRRLRKLYEVHKLAIANQKRRSDLMVADVGHVPGQKFYPLVKALGVRRLRREVFSDPKAPAADWDGLERREEMRNPNPGRRSYDNRELMARIRAGSAL